VSRSIGQVFKILQCILDSLCNKVVMILQSRSSFVFASYQAARSRKTTWVVSMDMEMLLDSQISIKRKTEVKIVRRNKAGGG